jgi:putative ABC transport system permease protein
MARKKMLTAISILGLAFGLTAVLLIDAYVRHEKSYDTFHKDHATIYRVTTEWNNTVTPSDKRATTVPWSGPGVAEAFPEVLAYTRLTPLFKMTGDNAVIYKNKAITESGLFLADPGFLKIFSFELLKGDPASALNAPGSIIITETIAKKYFGNEDPLGKALYIDTHGNLSGNDFKVTGVIQDAPSNAHFHYDFLISYTSLWEALNSGSTYWHWDNTYCYLLLHPEADAEALQKKITDIRVAQFGKDFRDYNDVVDFKLQPLTDIHLFSSLKGELSLNGDGKYLYLLIVVGFCILFSAYINHINLSTARAIERRTEIGVRKVAGSSKRQLMIQLLIEAILINGIAFVLAFIFARLGAPLMERLLNIHWPRIHSPFHSLAQFSSLMAILAAGVLLSAWYPALIVTAVKPADALKGNKITGTTRWTIKKYLVIAQFIFCIVFTSATFILYRQMQFMRHHDLGMNMDHVVTVQGYGFQPNAMAENFKKQLSSSSSITSIGSSSAVPGDEITELGLRPKVKIDGEADAQEVKLITVDEDFFKTLDIEFLAGRNFERGSGSEKDAVILNEAAMDLLGSTDPHPAVLTFQQGFRQGNATIVGIIKNYHQRSLKNKHEPIAFVPNWVHDFGWNKRYYFIKFTIDPHTHAPDPFKPILSEIENAWHLSNPGYPFHYFFLDSHFNYQYKTDHTFSAIFFLFSAVAIFITYLGLFGLVTYITAQRTKEIGIRKVLGASVRSILMLLSLDFLKLILLATIVGIPLVWWASHQWLDTYAFRTHLNPWMFTIPLILIFLLAFGITILRSIKIAVSNPVDSIRYE